MTAIEAIIAGYILVLGLCLGSFLNVCIFRIPEELSVVKPRSRCPKCGYQLRWLDNIPVLSWLLLGAKCRECKAPISVRYPSVELLSGILFLWMWLVHPNWLAFPYGVLFFGLILGSFVDIDHMWIPDRTTIGGMIAGPIFSFVFPAMHGMETHMEGLLQSVYGLAFGFALLWSVAFFGRLILKKDAMGFGDVKLMGALGAFLGLESIIFIVFVSSLIGSIVGVTLIVSGKNEWQCRIPFGPYIALAAIVWVLGGSAWWDAYTAWLTGAV